jgi:outer membrane biogenesis lipoprotein LolB
MKKIKQLLNRKLMPWKTNRPLLGYVKQVLLLLLASFYLAGCASKPWKEPLGDAEADSVRQLVDTLVARDSVCGNTLEGDLLLFYQNPFKKEALAGFLQFSMPSSYKFVITNPFGQPLLVITGDLVSFQAINTLEKKYLSGSLQSFGLRNDIPVNFLKGDWASWLTGRNHLSSQAITDIRDDKDSRGIWLTFKSKEQAGVCHLLLDRDKKVFLVRVLENDNGKEIARITYDNWLTLGKCKQPLEINITGLDYGTDIHIKLSNVLITNEKETFRIRPPAGYMQQHMP